MESLSVFGKEFQENLCKLMYYDRTFADQMSEILKINFLELRYLQVFVEKIFDYKHSFGDHPTGLALTSILRSELEDEPPSLQKQLRDFFVRVQTSSDVKDKDYIKKTSLDFCKKQVLKEAMIKSIPLLNQSSFEEVEKLINDALKSGTNSDYGYDYIKDFEERFKTKTRNPVSTGWDKIDKITQGGFGTGELVVCISPTGCGKSHVLVHLGAQALKQGKNVVHFTCELADNAVARRYDACLTGYALNDLNEYKENIFEKIKNIDGQLIVKEYPTKSASVITLRNHLERLIQNEMEVDLIIVDYADLLRAKGKNLEKRHELESIYEDLRGLGQHFNCPIITASQTNRKGLNEEIITMESISEAFNKCFVADFIFSLSRTVRDKNSNIGRYFIAKNRNGPDGLIYSVFIDTATVAIKVLEKEQVDKVNQEIQNKKERSAFSAAQELYKKMKNEQT